MDSSLIATLSASVSKQSTNKIDFDPKDVHAALQRKGIDHLHHANTVGTSITYFQKKALLSREYVESNGLNQTKQMSDKDDKHYGIWNYIFLDGLDLGKRFNRRNEYGPLLFKFDISVLLSKEIKAVRITRYNPCKWSKSKDQSVENFYFTDLSDFEATYLAKKKGTGADAGIMFMIETVDGSLPLTEVLRELELDDPGVTFDDGSKLLEIAMNNLKPYTLKLPSSVVKTVKYGREIVYRSLHNYLHTELVRLYSSKNHLTNQ